MERESQQSAKSTSTTNDSDESKNFERDLLEPQYYPDPALFRASLEKLTRDDIELRRNLTSNKATLRVLAPYLKIMHKDQKRIIDSVRTQRLGRDKDTKVLFRKKSKEHLDIVPDISEKIETIVSIHETADVLKAILKASTIVSYLVDHARNELYQSPRHVVSSTANLKRKIELGTTMASYAAFSKKHVVTDNVYNDDRFPLGLGFPGSFTKFALCVPIITSDDKVIAVYEVARNSFEKAFDKRDIQTVLAVTGWMGVAILQNTLYTSLVRQNEIRDYLLQLTDHYHSGHANVDKALSDIVMFAREAVGAERCNLFITVRMLRGSVIVEEYDQGVDNSEVLFKRRSKKQVDPDGSTLSRVMINKEIVNKHKLVLDVNSNEDSAVRSLLCVPLLNSDDVIGAIQLVNKRTSSSFDNEDVETLKTFANFCAVNLHHFNARKRATKADLTNDVTREMLMYHMKPCIHDQEAVEKRSKSLPDKFFTLNWYPSAEHIPILAEITINMFHEVLGDSFMTSNNIPKFVLTVQNCYRPNPYHNFLHAVSVAHTMANIITRYHPIFNGIERISLMVAALCHDLDHRGYTNNFIHLTNHYLSRLYKTSPLENHHFAVTKLIIEQCGLFKYLEPELYNELLTEIYECIIATDLSLHFKCRMELMRTADEQTLTFNNTHHRRLVKNIIMTACDLTGQTKPLPVCKQITDDVYEEFFQQGDIEKTMGFIPLPTMDRDKKHMIAENQVQFLTVVVLPCVEIVTRIFSNLSPMVCDSKLLLMQWKELIEYKDQDTWKPDESVAPENA